MELPIARVMLFTGIAHPFSVISTHVRNAPMLQKETRWAYNNSFSAIVTIYSEQGIKGFYRGYFLSLPIYLLYIYSNRVLNLDIH